MYVQPPIPTCTFDLYEDLSIINTVISSLCPSYDENITDHIMKGFIYSHVELIIETNPPQHQSHGLLRVKDDNNMINEQRYYRDGIVDGVSEEYIYGKIVERTNYINTKPCLSETFDYKTGVLINRKQYHGNSATISEAWYTNGNRRCLSIWDYKGEQLYYKQWSPDNRVEKERCAQRDKEHTLALVQSIMSN